jgi:hypothetical protein
MNGTSEKWEGCKSFITTETENWYEWQSFEITSFPT